MRSAAFGFTSILTTVSLVAVAAEPERERPPISAADDAELARGARLETMLRIALERNREVAETQARARAAEARRQAASGLPDLEVKYEQWGVPLARPYALDRADTLMIGVRQTFPAWGSRAARGRAAAEDAGGAHDASRARQQEITAQVRRTYATYYRADQEVRLHRDHVGLTSRVLELARLNHRTGHGSMQDVLRLQVELTRLHLDVARVEREQRSSRALLNTLMDRPAEAALGPPEDPGVVATKDLGTLEQSLDANRPEIDAAARAVRRSQALLDGTRSSSRFPDVMVGLDYWYMPLGLETQHGYGAMVAINLPWLSQRRRYEERDAEQTVQAEQQALESMRNAVRYQLRDAAAGLEAARASFAIIEQDLLPEAQRSLDATQAAYAAGGSDATALLDALRSYLDVRIERVRALAELVSSQADLERAAGTLAARGAGK